MRKRPDADDEADSERLRQTHLEQVNVNKDFRDIADFFATVRYLHVVPQLVREPERSVGRTGDPFGGDFLEQIARADKRTRASRLKRIESALRIAVPQLQDLELRRDARGTPHLRGNYRHWRPHGHWQSEEAFSDGTLRLVGLLWAVMDGTGPLLLEEPELSLHPEVVRQIPQMFGQVQRRSGRQIIVSSHSTEILDDSGIGLDEVLTLLPLAEGTSVEPWFVLVDLDRDKCAAEASRRWLPEPVRQMCFRIAVPEVEAWLMADYDQVASFLGVSAARVPANPEGLSDPKATLLDLARASRRRDIRTGLVPRDGSGSRVGPTYASDLRHFAVSQWRPLVASANAPSLARCLARVEAMAHRLTRGIERHR